MFGRFFMHGIQKVTISKEPVITKAGYGRAMIDIIVETEAGDTTITLFSESVHRVEALEQVTVHEK